MTAEGTKLTQIQINQQLDAQNTQGENVLLCGKAGKPFAHFVACYFSR